MDLIKFKLLILITALFITSKCIRCNSTYSDSDEESDGDRFKDVTDAVSSMYAYLIDHLPLERRCDRYAILLAMAEVDGPPFEKTVQLLSTAHQSTLDEQLQHLDGRRRIAVFMNAIDRYRTSQLAPGFIDLIDCIRKIDSPLVGQFFDDKELLMIEKLYRQVLASPGVKLDPGKWKLGAFHPYFRTTLRRLFKNNLQADQALGGSNEQGSSSGVGSSGKQSDLTSRLMQGEKRGGKRRRDWKDGREILRERRLEEKHRLRERDRLRKRRRRVLDRDELRERERKSQQNRRRRMSELLKEEWQRKTLHRKRQQTYRQKVLQLQMQQEEGPEDSEHGQLSQSPPPIARSSDTGPIDLPSTREHMEQLELQQPDKVAPQATDHVPARSERQQSGNVPEVTRFELIRPIAIERIQNQDRLMQLRPYPPLVSARPQSSLLSLPTDPPAASSYSFDRRDDLHQLQRVILDSPAYSADTGATSFLRHLIQTPNTTVDEREVELNQIKATASTSPTPQPMPLTTGEDHKQGIDWSGDMDEPSSINQTLAVIDRLLSHQDNDLGDPWQDFDRELDQRRKTQ